MSSKPSKTQRLKLVAKNLELANQGRANLEQLLTSLAKLAGNVELGNVPRLIARIKELRAAENERDLLRIELARVNKGREESRILVVPSLVGRTGQS